jgi:hypothetical protein
VGAEPGAVARRGELETTGMTAGAGWDPATGPIDPAWWSLATDSDSVYVGEWDTSGLIAIALGERRDAATGDGERAILDVLARCASAMLEATDWAEPFRPEWEMHGRRSLVPADLAEDDITLLARLAPLISQPVLQARVADVAWTYGDRSNRALLDLATDAYLATPLGSEAWWSGGRDSWTRGLELTKRRGRDGHARLDTIRDSIRDRVMALGVADGALAAELSAILRTALRLGRADAESLVEHLDDLAAAAAHPETGRGLFREAAAWHARLGDVESERDCLVEAAELYVVEADLRLTADPDSVMVAGMFVEDALAGLAALPRKYRAAHDLDPYIARLRTRLNAHRRDTLQEMTTVRTEPVDLSNYAEGVRTRIDAISSGPLEALATLASIHPLAVAAESRSSARECLMGSFVRIIPGETYSSDARKVARQSGGHAEPDEDQVFAAAVGDHQARAQMLMVGFVLPGLEAVNLRFRCTRQLLGRICLDSPLVPPQREGLWASGLYRGLSGEWEAAVSILAPQIEHLVRHRLQQAGVHTRTIDTDGVQMEKALGALLVTAEAETVLGPDLLFELRAMMVEQGGANLRNNVAHGLLDDGAAWSHASAYVWWLALRLAVVPVWQMMVAGARRTAEAAGQSG